MTSIKKLAGIILLACVVLTLAFLGCKKTDNQTNTISKEDQTAIEKARLFVKKEIEKDGGIAQIYPVTVPAKAGWTDMKHNSLTKPQFETNAACDGTFPFSTTLVQYSRIYHCISSTNGYTVGFQFDISWESEPVAYGFKGQKTEGYVSIDYAGATYSYVADLEKIQDLGIDNSYPTAHIYRVFFKSNPSTNMIPSAYINASGADVKISAQFAPNCSFFVTPYVLYLWPLSTYGITNTTATTPCNRIEKCYIDPSNTIGGNYLGRIVFNGWNAALNSCNYGGTMTQPDLQEVEYSLNGGSWQPAINDITVTPTSLGIYGSKYIRSADIARSALLSGPYNIIVRYRNWKYPSTQSTWPDPTTVFGSCYSITAYSGQPYSNYVYEYFTGTF